MSFERISSIKKIGKSPTLDIEVGTPDHIFYANGIASSNSHAISYGLDGYWTAYIKAHFPLSFYGAWLLGANWKNADKYEEIAQLLNDAKLNDIEVKTPQIDTLTYHTSIVNDEFVQFGLIETKDIGPATAKKVLDELKVAASIIKQEIIMWSWTEFLIFAAPKLGKSVCEALISVGGLDNIEKMPRTRRIFEYEQISKLSKDTELKWLQTHYHTHKWKTLIEALTALKPVRKMKDKIWIGGGGTASVKGEAKVGSIVSLLQNPPMKLIDTIEWIASTEEHYLGCPVTITKIDGCMEATEANTSVRDFITGRDGYMIMALEVVSVKQLVTKTGKNPGSKMAKIMVRDSTATIDGVVFPKQWAECGQAIYEGSTILAWVERTKDKSLSIKKAKEIS